MNETKFTKGEWNISDNGSYLDIGVGVLGSDSETLYEHRVVIGITYENEANAHLIAAAPEMYAMLERAVNYIHNDSVEDFCYEYQDIKSLLAKARGEV